MAVGGWVLNPVGLAGEVSSGELELQLARRAQEGDRQAFDWLMQRHLKSIYNLVVRMLGDREAAEDLVQDTFLSAFRSLANFRRECRIATWLHRIAVNKVLNHRARRRLKVVELDGEKQQVPDQHSSPARSLEEAELQKLLQRCVRELPENLRVVFVLRELEGKNYDEIAEILETTPENVRVRLHRAKKELLKRLRPYLNEGGKETP